MKNDQSSLVIKAGVGVIVCKKQTVLVGVRKNSHGDGCWAFPGGHIDSTDVSLKACGEREVYEETGIICNVYKPDHHRDDLFTTYDILSEDGTKRYVTCYLLAEYLSGGKIILAGNGEVILPREPEKCGGWYWKSLDELAAIIFAQKQNAWIPINPVIFYLNQIWKKSQTY